MTKASRLPKLCGGPPVDFYFSEAAPFEQRTSKSPLHPPKEYARDVMTVDYAV